MTRLTYGTVKELIARILGKCETDPNVLDIVNRAQERLLYEGKFVGTYGRYWVCLREACLTLPRQLETVEAVAICDRPGTVRGEWFEFLGSGPGVVKEDSDIGDQIVDRGEACAFDDVRGSNKKLAIYASQPETAGAVVNVQFYNDAGGWVRTSYGGSWIEGENLAIPAAGGYTYSTDFCAPLGLIRVVKPVTNGVIRLYEYNTVTATYKPLAYYEPDETIPVYRRYIIPNLECMAGGSCNLASVIVMGKMRYIPATVDASFLMVSHVDALRLMCQAIWKEQNNLWTDALVYEKKAIELLDKQLNHYKGDGEVQPVIWQDNTVTGPAVPNLI